MPKENREKLRPTDCRVQYCLFYNDHPKQPGDDDSDTFGGNYVGGMDIMYAKRWTISDNVFMGIHGRTGEARGAIFLWVDAEDCIVERNMIIDCDCGICLGNSHRGEGTTVHCTRCTVRNNFVTRCPENDILADYTRDCKILQQHGLRSQLALSSGLSAWCTTTTGWWWPTICSAAARCRSKARAPCGSRAT